MTKAKLTRIPKRVLACVLAVLMVLSCLTMLPFTGFAASLAHAQLESPAVVQDGSKYYAFGSGNVLYESSDMANWGTQPKTYVEEAGLTSIQDAFGDSSITAEDLKSPEVVQYAEDGEWYLYLSIMDGSRSMIVVGTSSNIDGPYDNFQKVLETGFNRGDATDVMQDYFGKSYNGSIPAAVKEWGKGTCYYYSNFLGLNYQWFTEELPRAYAPSIAADGNGNYYMAYGYRNGGIWLQKIDPATGLIDFTWSGDNWNTACEGTSAEDKRSSDYHYMPEEHYDTNAVETHRLDPYFGELVVHTTEGGDTDTLESTVSRAGEEPELYFVNGTAYLQVTYGGAGNGDGYNVRSYKNSGITLNNVNVFDFVDMNSESGVDNADASMIASEDVKRTGLKLMGDYNLPGTPDGEYYTSPGASSVTQGEDGMLFYNYQVKTNFSANGTVKSAEAEMRSHILLHNSENQPLVMPFEYTGAADKDLYEAANAEYDIDNDIAGQYYVTMTTDETSTAKQGITGLTLTAGHLVAGAFSGSWDFEDITLPDGSTYQNGLVITDENGNEYHGAFLKQSPEDPSTLNAAEGKSAPVTFAIVVGNTTYWGVWYDKYTPASENNADAGLSVSPAIYTGGALELNTVNNGELGLKYGNYISVLRFAQNDYSTYLTIDDRYIINGVIDDDFRDKKEYNNGIKYLEVIPDNYTQIITDGYLDRGFDSVEADSSDTADKQAYTAYTSNKSVADGVTELEKMLEDKYKEAKQKNQRVYILYGWLDSGKYGRNASFAQDEDSRNDKGDITLRVSYYDSTNQGATFTERVYSHVYQQPVPANVSGAVYSRGGGTAGNYWWVQNSIFMRAEGSYSADSYLLGTTEVRNTTMSDKGKYFAAYPTFGYYNDSLFGSNPNYGNQQNGATEDFFHGNTHWILTGLGTWLGDDRAGSVSFNGDYRPSSRENPNIDIAVSYEQTVNEWDQRNNLNFWAHVPGSRAEYYVDISSPTTSNIASYYEEATDSFEIPMYYSNISNDNDYHDYYKRFNFTEEEINYNAGLYPADDYLSSSSERTGVKLPKFTSDTNYPFQINFDQIDAMYADNGSGQWGMQWDEMSYSANALINVSRNSIKNTAPQSYNAEKTDDYNFYVRTRSETVNGVNDGDGHARLVEDLEYGIYVSDKSYVRDYYDSITQGKFATGCTYYSWEAYRDATRLVADYLNNYMDLADSKGNDPEPGYQPNGSYELGKKSDYDGWLAAPERNWTVDDVLNDENKLDDMLAAHPDEVQDVYCYLLNDAVERLFDFEYYNEFNQAYQQYDMLDNFDEYTTSSWRAYQQYRNIEVADGLTLEALAGYDWAAKDDPDSTPDDPNSTEKPIYNPTDPDKDVVNDSWKIINDEFFKKYNMTAREIFAKATALINEAMDVLRHKADYDDLDEQMFAAESYKGSLDIASVPNGNNAGNLGDANMGENATVKRNSDIFSIDRSTVNALANQMNQGTDDNGNSYVEDEDGNRYTISSMAAFDKVYQSIWEVTDSITTDELNGAGNFYYDSVAEDDVEITDRQEDLENPNNPDKYYSNDLRDDQQYFTNDSISGEDTEHLSTVQQKIVDKTTQMQMVLNYLKANKMAESLEDQYQTFDYLIDVISTIDFNAYTEAGQELLWNKLYELLVQGGVYLVNQQLFDPSSLMEGAAIDEDSPLYEVLYGDNDQTYYTGWNATNVDGYTTELMELLTDLDENYRNEYQIDVKVHITDSVNGVTKDTIASTEHHHYGDVVTLSAEMLISDYDPANYYVYGWSIETEDSVHNLKNVTSYTFTANQNATINVYVAQMPTPNIGDTIPVSVVTKLGGRTELALNVPQNDLAKYKVSADGATLTVTLDGETIAAVDAVLVPYYTFQTWTAGKTSITNTPVALDTLVEKGIITFMPSYTLIGCEYKITVNGQNYNNLPGVQFDTYVQFTPDDYPAGDLDGTFYAWLVKEGNDYKIASYNKTFWLYATDDEDYVQVNYDKSNGCYYIYDGETLTTDKVDAGQPSGDIEAIDPTSLYYRLSHKLLDSWSNMSTFDEVSDKVSLYSHFTDQSDTETTSVKRIESGVLFTDKDAVGADSDQFVMDNMGDSSNRIFKYVASNPSSSGQYVISINVPEYAQKGQTAYMRSYVTYTYTYTNDDGDSTVITRTEYSDVESVPVPGSSSTN